MVMKIKVMVDGEWCIPCPEGHAVIDGQVVKVFALCDELEALRGEVDELKALVRWLDWTTFADPVEHCAAPSGGSVPSLAGDGESWWVPDRDDNDRRMTELLRSILEAPDAS